MEKSNTLQQDINIIELLELLKQNGKIDLFNGVLHTIDYIGKLEKTVDSVTRKLNKVTRELKEVKDRTNPIVKTYVKTIGRLENQLDKIKTKLTSVKEKFIDGCKNVITAVKQKGIIGLNHAVGILDLKKDLNAIFNSLKKLENSVDKAICNLDKLEKAACPQEKPKTAEKPKPEAPDRGNQEKPGKDPEKRPSVRDNVKSKKAELNARTAGNAPVRQKSAPKRGGR